MDQARPHPGKVQNWLSDSSKLPYFSTVVLFVVCSAILGASAYWNIFSGDIRLILKVSMAVASLAAWLALGRSDRLRPYRPLAAGFLGVSLGLVLARFVGDTPMKLLGTSVDTVQGVAVAKLSEALSIVLSILVVHFATGGSREGLFLKRGNLRLGLIAGAIGFAAFAAIGAVQVAGSGLTWATVAAAIPWIAIFIFSNAFMEELWFRALFLKPLGALVGARTTLVITSLVFAAIHVTSTYVIDILVFMVALTALGLLWGWLMRKTDSIWGSVMIHAGSDVLVILGFLAGAKL